MEFATESKPKSASISAVIIRADGTVEDLGIVEYYHSNPIINAFWQVKLYLKGILRKYGRTSSE